MTWLLMWLNRSVTTINVILQLIYIYIYIDFTIIILCVFGGSVEQTAPNFTIINLLEVSFFWVRNLQQKSYCFTWNDFWYLYN